MRSKTTDDFLERERVKEYPYFVDTLGFKLRVDRNVYPPSEDSTLLAEQLEDEHYGVKPHETVLDFGTGTGYFALVAARRGARIVATDINPAAVQCAKNNALRNRLNQRIEFRVGKSFEVISPDEKFDLVAASLPFEAAEPRDNFEASVYDSNFETRREFFRKIKTHLTESGKIFFAYADYAERVAPLANFLGEYHFDLIVERRSGDGELNRVYLIKP